MQQRTLSPLIILVALTLFLTACHKNSQHQKDPKTPSDITLSVTPQSLTLRVGKSEQLKVSATPVETNLEYTYLSANKEIVTISNQGLVTAVAPGETSITISAKNASISVPVKVLPPVSITPSRYIGDTSQDERFHPIYVPVLAQMEERKEEIQIANEAKNWLFEEERQVPNGFTMFSYISPSKNDVYVDSRLIKRVAYLYTPGRTDRTYMLLFTEHLSQEDILARAFAGDSEAYSLLSSIANGYGFTEDHNIEDTKKGPRFTAYNRKQFPEGAVWLAITSDSLGGSLFGLRLQIAPVTSPKK